MAYTVGQAAKAVGRTKGAIQQAIANNKISAAKDEFGRWQIDPAELHRLYPPKKSQLNDAEHQSDPSYTAEIERLKATVEGLEKVCRQIEGERDSLREQLTAANDERRTTLRQLTALLTDQRAKATPDVIVTPPPTSNVIPTPPAPPQAPVAAPVENQLPAEQAPAKRKGWLGWLTG